MAGSPRRNLNKWSAEELKSVWEFLDKPGTKEDFLWRWAVRLYLSGQDPEPVLLEEGVSERVAYLETWKARNWLRLQRAKRRGRSQEILLSRQVKPAFTFENFGVTIDKTQHKDLGMTVVSIYCIVEVWDEDEETEKEYLVNFSDFKTKEWLTRLMVWALMNKKQVLVRPATEQAMATMRMFIPKDKSDAL